MKKLFNLILVLGLLFGGVASAENAYFVCKNKDILEEEFVLVINQKEKVLLRNYNKYAITFENEIHIKAEKEEKLSWGNLTFNKFTGDANLLIYDKKRIQFHITLGIPAKKKKVCYN